MPGYFCASCGVQHDDVPMCFLAPMPISAALIPETEWPARVLSSSDQFIIDDEHFFILGNLDIPIIGHDQAVRWTVWSSLSAASFKRAAELWETEGRESEPPYFGWLSSQIPGYERTAGLALEVRTQELGVRPLLVLAHADHRLSKEQTEGITWKRALELSNIAMGTN